MTSLEVIKTISEIARERSVEIYVVGGYVRDRIMGYESNDIDFVIVGDSIQFAKSLRRILDAEHFAYYKRFGTCKLGLTHHELEFVTARAESYRGDSRKPDVRPSDLLTDLSRRDFTINAIAIDICQDMDNLIDPFDGQSDIYSKLIRTPLEPDITFSDDPLRMIRAVRFASRFEFQYEPNTRQAITEYCHRLKIISPERILDELRRILTHVNAARGLSDLVELGLLQEIFPKFHIQAEVLRSHLANTSLGDLTFDEILALIAYLNNADAATASIQLKDLRCSNQEISAVQKCLTAIPHFKELLTSANLLDVKRFLFEFGPAAYRYTNIFIRFGIPYSVEAVSSQLSALDSGQSISEFTLALNGNDIQTELRLEEGRRVGEIIHELTEAILRDEVANTKKSLKAYLINRYNNAR